MANNEEWQRRSDEWIKMLEESARRKQKYKIEKNREKHRGKTVTYPDK